jgi:ATP-dependent protease ClpP protease subunit
MPYSCTLDGRKWKLQKADGSKTFGTHDSKKSCMKQLKAIYANEINNEAHVRFVGRLYNTDIDPKLITNEDTIKMVIEGEGGSVLGAIKIHNSLRQSGKRIVGYIPTIALSAHAILALACDELYIAENGAMMFHPPKAELKENSSLSAEELKNLADSLDVAETMLVNTLMSRTKKTEEECRAIMGKDTWYSAQQALESGIVDGIIPILRDIEVMDYMPVEIVNQVRKVQSMAVKELCDKFGIVATDENAEEKLVDFIAGLQKKLEPPKQMEISNSLLSVVRSARDTELRMLVSEGKCAPVQAEELKKNFLSDERVKADIQNDSQEFSNIVAFARKGEKQIQIGGSSGSQNPPPGTGGSSNALVRDAEKRREALKKQNA